ncbi:MAG: 3-oxoacyl-ACP reductase FabG [Gammaproteobacteria bacterium]|jgi:NAD(P)-dependent dehydrogenase (short-subunit alcohol dehydrogenase family)
MQGLKGKVAVCTGSGRSNGLGAAILRRLAAEGCDVVVSDLGNPDRMLEADDIGGTDEMQTVAEELRSLGARVLVVPCDVRIEADVKNLIDRTVDEFGRIDILVNNAGVGYMLKPFTESTLEEWQLVLDVNLTGAYLCSKHAALRMMAAGSGGRIINIASQAAKSGFPHLAAYVASKHGMVGFTRSVASELGQHGITVNAVCPNHVTTGLGAKQNEYYAQVSGQTLDEFLAAMRARIPLGRPGLPEDTAAAVAFLASDDARYITGEAMNVSGGEENH